MDITELRKIAHETQEKQLKIRLRCCNSSGCLSSQGEAVKNNLEKAIAEAGLEKEAEVVRVGCMGFCGQGPLVAVDPLGSLYEQVTPEQASSILSTLNLNIPPAESLPFQGDPNHPFFALQHNIVRENSGHIDPESIEDYIKTGGYEQLHHVIYELSPEQVIAEITKSGLRGRGGGGYPTGLKWATVGKMPGKQKYVICNADEGDPGAFMDRSVLESDPHRVLEGMAIAAYAVGANHGFIYVRAEYPLAIRRLQKAIQQAKKYGLLGSQIFDSTFDCKIDIRVGGGAFVCGEETALINSIEGGRGNPRTRPPYPAQSGLWECPTLINNVETFANIVPIIREGGNWYAGIGTAKSKGTKVFALTGKVKNAGLVEVPMGMTVRQVVEEIGGGVPDGGTIKAVQTGGPSGGCIPASALDTPIEYDALLALGTMMGSGGIIVIDDSTNMVDMTQFYMDFCQSESCGKCIPCRTGTVQLYEVLTKLINKEAKPEDIERLEALCHMVKETSLCGLGQSAPNPVLSTLRYFKDEYLKLVKTESFPV